MRDKFYILISAILMVLLANSFLVLAQVAMPHAFYGEVKFSDGSKVSDNLNVQAIIEENIVASTITKDSRYGYGDFPLIINDNGYAGKTISFKVSNQTASQTSTFVNGAITQLDLTIIASLLTPAPTPTPTPPAGGGGGGGGGGTAEVEDKATLQSIQTPIVSEFNLGELIERTLILGVGNEIKFSLIGEPHIITINEVRTNSVDLTISSDPIKLSISIGEIKQVDINSDGKNDLEINLVRIDRGVATLILKGINGISQIPTPTPHQPITGAAVSDGESRGFKFEGPVVSLVIIIIGLSLFFGIKAIGKGIRDKKRK